MNRNVRRVFGGPNDWPPDDAVGFLAWFQRQIDGIPREHQAGATIQITARDDEPVLAVCWERPETPAEERDRLDDDARRRYL